MTIQSLTDAIKLLDKKRMEVSAIPAIWQILFRAGEHLNKELAAAIRQELMSEGQ